MPRGRAYSVTGDPRPASVEASDAATGGASLRDAEYDAAITQTIQDLRAAEISFIPVRGKYAEDYASAKHPTLDWKPYQTRQPHAQEIQGWFDARLIGGLGIITGNVSRLLIPDFDLDTDPSAFLQFEAACPDLASVPTYTEQTPAGGKHLLFRLPPSVLHVDTIPSAVGELRAEGVMTVIAPTQTPAGIYRVEYGDFTTIYTLTVEQLDRLIAFYTARPKEQPKRREVDPDRQRTLVEVTALDQAIADALGVTGYNADGYSNPVTCPFHDDDKPSAAWNANKHALKCHAGCTSPGFATGWSSRLDTAKALGISALEPTPVVHISPVIHISTAKALLQRFPGRRGESTVKTTICASTVCGSRVTKKDLETACKGIVGRYAIQTALDAWRELGLIAGCEHVSLDMCVENPRELDTCSQPAISQKARHRPAEIFTVPSEQALATALGVEIHGVLDVTLDDLKNRALADILIEKHVEDRPQQYAYGLLGKEYGKSRSSARRYIASNARIERTEVYKQEVRISSVEQLIVLMKDASDPYHSGRFLESAQTGKRFPATERAAAYLLGQGETPIFRERGLNHLSLNRNVSLAQANEKRQLYRLKMRAYRLNRGTAGHLPHADYLERRTAIAQAFTQGNREFLESMIAEAKEARALGHISHLPEIIRPLNGCRSCGEIIPPSATLCETCAAGVQERDKKFFALAESLGAVITRLAA